MSMPKNTGILADIRELIELNVFSAQYSAWESSKFLSQVGYCRAGVTAGHYILLEYYSDYSYARGWWLWKRSITIENKGCDISFSGTTRHDNSDCFTKEFQVELTPTEEIRDIVILRIFNKLSIEPPNGYPQQSLGRKTKNPSGRFQGAAGFYALATEIETSITLDPEYIFKNKTTTLTDLLDIGI